MKQPGDQEAQRDIFNIDNKGTVTVINQPVPQRSRSESLLLQAVKQEVISRLAQSLHNAVFLNLGMQSQPQQVKRPWDAEIKIGSKSPEALLAETTILDVFDRSGIDGRLLILGEPGAGKTTTMLDLAKALCDRAEQNATAFIPVLLNLSSWQDPKQTMTAWLVEELKSKYGVRKDIGTKWLAEKQLLPLLDGLDEVKPEHQEGCVQAINCWLESEDRPPSLAVCCRREEYENVVRGQWQAAAEESQDETRMHLNGAILLQTLTDVQIQTYLTAANQPKLWQIFRQDNELWELIRTPLWLSITLLSYEGLSLNQWQQATSTEQRLALLLDSYVERMLHQELKSKFYRKGNLPVIKQTQKWLIYLASQLQRDFQTEFLIENIQPSSLLRGNQRWLYQVTVKFLVGIILLFAYYLNILIVQNDAFVGIQMVLFSLSLGIWTFLAFPNHIKDKMIFDLIGGIVFACLISMGLLGRSVSVELCAFITLTIWLLGSNLITNQTFIIEPVETVILDFSHAKREVSLSILGGVAVGILVGIGLYLGSGFLAGISMGVTSGSASTLLFFLCFGLSGRLIDSDVIAKSTPNSGIHRSGANSLKLMIFLGVASGLTLALFVVFPVLFAYLDSEWFDLHSALRHKLNGSAEKIIHAFQKAKYKSVHTSNYLFLLQKPTEFLVLKAIEFWAKEVGSSIITALLSIGVVSGLTHGGIACIQHFVLRTILFRSGSIPWNYARFLDYCTERLFLQRVGGRYRFIHKSLQEHFAEMRE